MRTQAYKIAFNRGLVSRLGMARADVKRLAFASEVHTNWISRVLGSMMLRPGTEHLGSSNDDLQAWHVPFVFAIADTALLEFTASVLRIWIDDALLTRATVTSAVANGNFDANLTSWTDSDEAGGTSVWVAGGYMGLTGNGTAAAIRDQTVVVTSVGVEHALRIIVQRGPVTLRVGTSATDDSYVNETELATGSHSLAFTPSGDFNIRFLSRLKRQVLVDSCNVEAAGVVELASPYAAGETSRIRHDQSGDVIFIAADGFTQRRVERRATRSWSIVHYLANDGPFRVANVGPITLTPAALSGNTTLTASAALFRSSHAPSTYNAGALFKLVSTGQNVTQSVTAQNTFTNAIRVTGVDNQRIFTITIDEDAAGAATFTLQRSLESDSGPWTDVQQWTADVTVAFDDGLDNQIVWYRLGVKTGDYVNGTHTVSLAYNNGTTTGICRVTGFTSSTVVDVEVLQDFGAITATDDWSEGEWSDYRGWPTAGTFHEGRLTWEGRNAVQESISDAFDSFDEEFEGDGGPINRTIGSGPVDVINWALSLQRLLLGGQAAEFSVRSSSLDEPLTPTNFNLKIASTQGSAAVAAVKIDQRGVMVQRGGTRIYELAFGTDGIDYEARHLSQLVPEIGRPMIVKAVVQRQPDTRIHFVRSDGTVALLIFDKVEEVLCFIEIETDGLIEDAVVLPGVEGDEEDHVYYSVKRTIGGAAKRFLEKWAFESECLGDAALCKLADSFVVYSGVAAFVIPVAHLEGERVVVWADGADVGTADARFVSLPGVAASYVSTPDSVVLDIVGDIDLRARVALDDWTPATAAAVVSKWGLTGNQRAYQLGVNTNGTLFMLTSTDGTGGTLVGGTSTVAPSIANGEPLWIRVTFEVGDADGNHVHRFYTSPDGSEGSWVQLGDTVTAAGVTSLFASTAVLEAGSEDTGAGLLLVGKVYRAQVYRGIEGTLVADLDPVHASSGDTTVEASSGETWTVHGTAKLTDQIYEVTGGVITLEVAATNVVVGLPYEAPWKSAKLVELMGQVGGALTDTQQISLISLILADTHVKGLKYGQSLTESEMDDLPGLLEGAPVDPDLVHTDYVMQKLTAPGKWSDDARICLLAKAPRPATVLAALAEIEHHG